MAARSRRQRLIDEAYAEAARRLRENHPEEFQRLLDEEQRERGVDV